jgi:hypothetical protein
VHLIKLYSGDAARRVPQHFAWYHRSCMNAIGRLFPAVIVQTHGQFQQDELKDMYFLR